MNACLTFRGRLIYGKHACFFMTCLIAFSAIRHSDCQGHKNSHLRKVAPESDAQSEHEEAGDLRYFASLDQQKHMFGIVVNDWLLHFLHHHIFFFPLFLVLCIHMAWHIIHYDNEFFFLLNQYVIFYFSKEKDKKLDSGFMFYVICHLKVLVLVYYCSFYWWVDEQ